MLFTNLSEIYDTEISFVLQLLSFFFLCTSSRLLRVLFKVFYTDCVRLHYRQYQHFWLSTSQMVSMCMFFVWLDIRLRLYGCVCLCGCVLWMIKSWICSLKSGRSCPEVLQRINNARPHAAALDPQVWSLLPIDTMITPCTSSTLEPLCGAVPAKEGYEVQPGDMVGYCTYSWFGCVHPMCLYMIWRQRRLL